VVSCRLLRYKIEDAIDGLSPHLSVACLGELTDYPFKKKASFKHIVSHTVAALFHDSVCEQISHYAAHV